MIIAIDWKAFEAECKKIVHDISDRFIDLGLDDHESDFAAGELQAKQERFEREFSRMQFNFDALTLQLPAASSAAAHGNEDAVLDEEEKADFGKALSDQLAGDISDIVDIIHGKLRSQLLQEGGLIETSAA